MSLVPSDTRNLPPMRVTCGPRTASRSPEAASPLCPFLPSDTQEEEADALCQAGSSLAAVELPRKRKGGVAEERSGGALE